MRSKVEGSPSRLIFEGSFDCSVDSRDVNLLKCAPRHRPRLLGPRNAAKAFFSKIATASFERLGPGGLPFRGRDSSFTSSLLAVGVSRE